MSKTLLALLISGLLIGCGSSDDDSDEPQTQDPVVQPDPDPTPIQGILIDSAVIGIGYRTETQEGVTDAEGNYSYLEGETVTFFIGDLEFPATTATGIVTPFNIADTENVDDNQLINIARLLQSLDQDGDTSNGITITETAAAAAEPVDFTLGTDEFAQSAAVLATVQNGGQDTAVSGLIDEAEAVEHLTEQVASNGVQVGIVGTWVPIEDENDLLTIVFFNDGSYAHFEVDLEDQDEDSGMEWGNYTRDSETNRVTASQMFDGNGDTGLTDFTTADGAPQLFAQVTEMQLMMSFDEDADGTEDGSLTFDMPADDGIVGTWLVEAVDDQLADENDFLMLIFNADGTYIHAEVDADDTEEMSGMEWGTYSIDADTNLVTVTQVFDNNGDTGLTDFAAAEGPDLYMELVANKLMLRIDEDADGNIDTQLSFKRQ